MFRSLSRASQQLRLIYNTVLEPSFSHIDHLSTVAAASQCHTIQCNRKYFSFRNDNNNGTNTSKQWEILRHQGYEINPCNSKLHPSVTEAGIQPDSEEERSVQEAYTPESVCFGCGPASPEGLHLRSFRIPGGLEASIILDSKYCAFPGIINGGIISTLFDCHGNWTAAIALMDRGCLPKPPLTLTYELLVTFQEPTPPDEPLIVKSEIINVKDSGEVGAKATVQVDMSLYQSIGGHEKLLATGSGLFKKLGALRAL